MTDTVYTAGSVPRVPNKRKPGQTMLTFWLPDEEAQAVREAIAYFKSTKTTNEPEVTVTSECRRALRNTVKRAEKRAEEAGRLGRAEKKDTDHA